MNRERFEHFRKANSDLLLLGGEQERSSLPTGRSSSDAAETSSADFSRAMSHFETMRKNAPTPPPASFQEHTRMYVPHDKLLAEMQHAAAVLRAHFGRIWLWVHLPEKSKSYVTALAMERENLSDFLCGFVVPVPAEEEGPGKSGSPGKKASAGAVPAGGGPSRKGLLLPEQPLPEGPSAPRQPRTDGYRMSVEDGNVEAGGAMLSPFLIDLKKIPNPRFADDDVEDQTVFRHSCSSTAPLVVFDDWIKTGTQVGIEYFGDRADPILPFGPDANVFRRKMEALDIHRFFLFAAFIGDGFSTKLAGREDAQQQKLRSCFSFASKSATGVFPEEGRSAFFTFVR